MYMYFKDAEWMKMTPMQTVSAEGNIYTGKEMLSGLPPNDYQVRVRAKNSHGWSSYSEEKIFNEGLYSLYMSSLDYPNVWSLFWCFL